MTYNMYICICCMYIYIYITYTYMYIYIYIYYIYIYTIYIVYLYRSPNTRASRSKDPVCQNHAKSSSRGSLTHSSEGLLESDQPESPHVRSAGWRSQHLCCFC